MTNRENCLEVEDLEMSYYEKLVLKSVNITLQSGKIIGVIGPNGSGKSTFLKGILEIIPKNKGRVTFFNEPLEKVRNRIAYTPQRESVDWDFPISVYELVEMGLFEPKKWRQKKTAVSHSKILNALEQVGLRDLSQRPIGQLSGGQQQRVFVARALVQDADLIIMDEPFVGIDITSQEAIIKLLQEMRSSGKTILLVHHDLATVAHYFDDVMLFNNELIAYGSVEKVLQSDILSPVYGVAIGKYKWI